MAKMKLLYEQDSDGVSVWTSSAAHNHEPEVDRVSALSQPVKAKIVELMKKNQTALMIQRELQKVLY